MICVYMYSIFILFNYFLHANINSWIDKEQPRSMMLSESGPSTRALQVRVATINIFLHRFGIEALSHRHTQSPRTYARRPWSTYTQPPNLCTEAVIVIPTAPELMHGGRDRHTHSSELMHGGRGRHTHSPRTYARRPWLSYPQPPNLCTEAVIVIPTAPELMHGGRDRHTHSPRTYARRPWSSYPQPPNLCTEAVIVIPTAPELMHGGRDRHTHSPHNWCTEAVIVIPTPP